MSKTLGIVIGLLIATGTAFLFVRREKHDAVNQTTGFTQTANATAEGAQQNQYSPTSGAASTNSQTSEAAKTSPKKPVSAKDGTTNSAAATANQSHSNDPEPASKTGLQNATTGNRTKPRSGAAAQNENTPRLVRASDITLSPSRGILEDYAVYFAQANLTPEEKKQFIAIISEERATSRDIRDLTKTTNLSPDEQIKLIKDSLDQTRQDLAAVLPESKVAAYREYRATLPYRNLIETTAALCTPTGEPISAETKEAAIAALRKTKGFSPYTSTVRNDKDLSRGDNLACTAISHLLSPTQLEAFRTTLTQRREEAAARQNSVAPAKR